MGEGRVRERGRAGGGEGGGKGRAGERGRRRRSRDSKKSRTHELRGKRGRKEMNYHLVFSALGPPFLLSFFSQVITTPKTAERARHPFWLAADSS